LVGVSKVYLGKAIGWFDDVIIGMKGNMSRVVSCGRRDGAVLVFMFEFEVLVEFLFIEIIVFHDLEEFFQVFGKVVKRPEELLRQKN